MSWPLLLANYPRSIMKGTTPIFVLSLVERGGLITEDELETQVELKSRDLKSTLMDLRVNQLIEYGEAYLKATQRGKELLSRFGLDTAIRDDLFDHLNVDSAERDALSSLLPLYRDRAFSSYLNSICAARSWSKLAKLTPFEDSEEEIVKTSAGMRVILVCDMANWWFATGLNRRSEGNLRRQGELVALTIDHWRKGETADDVASKYARALLVIPDVLAGPELDAEAPPRRDEKLFSVFYRLKMSYEQDLWFPRWQSCLGESRARLRVKWHRNHIDKLISNLRSCHGVIPTTGLLWGQDDLQSQRFVLRLSKQQAESEKLDLVLEHVLMARDLAHFASLSGISEAAAKGVVEKLLAKCEDLLEKGRIAESSAEGE